MGVPAPASTAEAVDMVLVGLRYLAAADPAAPPADPPVAADPPADPPADRLHPGGLRPPTDWRGYPEGASGVSWPASATAASSAANSSDQPPKGIAGRSL